MAQSKWWIGVLVASLGWASGADAQYFLDARGGSTTCTQAAFSACMSGNSCSAGGRTGTCRARSAGGTYCHPDGALLCCDDSCDGSDTCVTLNGGPNGVCLPDDAILCVDSGGVSGQQLVDCFTAPGGERGPIGAGDCDRDGVSNSAEALALTGADRADRARMVCTRPLPRGILEGTSCEPLLPCDTVGDGCQPIENDPDAIGTCQITPDETSLRCTPEEDSRLYCGQVGGAHFECLTVANGFDPRLEDEVSATGGTYCVPVDCDGLVSLDQCIRAPSSSAGDPPVPFEAGDCDGDLIPNAEERSASEICVSNLEPDAGIGDVDAGPIDPANDAGPIDPGQDAGAETDAGPAADAGAPSADSGGVSVDAGEVDGGPGTPTFSGGGGCACRAGSSRSPLGGASAFALLGLLALLVRRRRG